MPSYLDIHVSHASMDNLSIRTRVSHALTSWATLASCLTTKPGMAILTSVANDGINGNIRTKDPDEAFLHVPSSFLRGLSHLNLTFDVVSRERYFPGASVYN